jgi:excisionase family DNA binding protein
MVKLKDYLSTGQAAAIFSVDPDTVLRWIKSGKIPAIRTPGGHYRIPKDIFLNKIIRESSFVELHENRPTVPYCWEFNSESGMIRDGCKECIVYKSKATQCYELCDLPESIGHAKLFCTDSCKNCEYFKSIFQSAN